MILSFGLCVAAASVREFCLVNSTIRDWPRIFRFTGECPVKKTAIEPTPSALVYSSAPKPDLDVPGFNVTFDGPEAQPDDHFLLLSFDERKTLDPMPGQYANRLGPGIRMTKEWALTDLQLQDEFYENRRIFGQSQKRKPLDYNYHIVPQTFRIPEENARFYLETQQNKMYQEDRMYYYRPPESGSGDRVVIDNDYRRLVHGRSGLVSLHDPPLTHDGFKFDLKFLVLVTSVDPLVAFYRPLDGKVRFARAKYQKPQIDASTDVHVPTDANARPTSWLFEQLDAAPRDFGFYEPQDLPPAPLSRHFRRQISRVLTQTLVGVYPRMLASVYGPPQYNSFEYFEASLYLTPWGGVKLYDIHSIADVPNALLLQALDLVGLRANFGSDGEFLSILEDSGDLGSVEDSDDEGEGDDEEEEDKFHAEEVRRGAQVIADQESRLGEHFERLRVEDALGEFREPGRYTEDVYREYLQTRRARKSEL